MNKNERKKYFIKDTSLRNADKDMFNYSDIAEVLDDVIVTNSAPYNIAVIGRWGLGKSSLVNLVTERYKKDPNHYIVQEINAWKYEKESLRKVFLKQLWQGISQKKVRSFEIIKKEIANVLESTPEPDEKQIKRKTRKRLLCNAAVAVLVTVVLFALYKIVQGSVLGESVWSWNFWLRAFLSYCKNIGTILFVPILIAISKILLEDYQAKQTKKIEVNFPIETTDDYEIFLETKIREQLGENPNLKIVTIIDDIDRLSIDKIVEALDALKAFVGFEGCIFIVPFDDEIIKRALDKKRESVLNEQADVIESELILDKLFQFKIYLPPILEFDIQKYALELAKQEIPDFMMEYCDEAIMEKVIKRVLIHHGVRTPRQVKKLINAFVNNYMIASARENSGRIQKGLLTAGDGIMQLAQVAVLQVDFNYFYDLLFKDRSCIDKLLMAHENQISVADLPIYLSEYFETSDNNCQLKNEYEDLLNFLTRTNKYRVEDIIPYLYLAQDDISVLVGDDISKRVVNALKSGNINTVKNLMKEADNIGEIIKNYLQFQSDDVEEVLKVAISIFESLGEAEKEVLSQNIIERTLELKGEEQRILYSVPASGVFAIADYSEQAKFKSEFISNYIRVFSVEEWLDEKVIVSELAEILMRYAQLDENAKRQLDKVIDLCITSEEIVASSLFPCIDATRAEDFTIIWALPWFRKLCHYIDSENDFSKTATSHLQYAFSRLVGSVELNKLMVYVMKLVKYVALLPTVDAILRLSVGQSEKKTVKDVMQSEDATKIAELIIEYDFVKNHEQICRILTGLPYYVNENNSSKFDEFALHFVEEETVDQVIEYCGQKNYYEFLPKTITKLIDVVFEDGLNDDLLALAIPYFTNEQRDVFLRKITETSKYGNNKSYERVTALYIVLTSCEGCDDMLQNIAKNTLLTQLNSYYNYQAYAQFVFEAMGIIKAHMNEEIMDTYVKALLNRFSSNRKMYLNAINQIAGTMSANTYNLVFAKIMADVQPAEFELALDVILNHDNIRPRDQENLTKYRNFLVKNLTTTSEPNHVLNCIRGVFATISDLKEFVTNALENEGSDIDLLGKALGKFLNNSKSIDSLVREIVSISGIEAGSKALCGSINGIRQYNHEEIFSRLADSLNGSENNTTLVNMADFATHNLKCSSAEKLVRRCLELSFEHINMTNDSMQIIRMINERRTEYKEKKEMADVLRNGFKATTSEQLKENILSLVASMKIKPQFKKSLEGEELEFYQKWIH